MKPLILLASACAINSAQAQLVNGSFENLIWEFSTFGWEWTCEPPQGMMDAPNVGGTWSAWKEAGHAKGCFNNHLFQRLTNVQYGIPYQLSGWVKCPVADFAVCLGGHMGFGTLSNGQFALAEGASSTDTAWTFLTLEHVFDPGVDDTAIVYLNSGFIGGPINPLPAGFDQLELSLANSVHETLPLKLSVFVDADNTRLHVGSTARMQYLELYDATGRSLKQQRASGTTEILDLSVLKGGQYLLRASTEGGTITKRFVKR